MIIFDGKREAEKVLLDLKKRIKREGLNPRLAVISVSPDYSSRLFIKNKKTAAKETGIKVLEYKFSQKDKEELIIQKIKELNRNSAVHGVIVQLPLPGRFSRDKIIAAIDPKKDVDGFHKENRKKLKKGNPFFFPPFPSAILAAARKASRNLKGKKIVILAGSDIFGKTFKTFFEREGLKTDFILKNKLSKLQSADIVVTALGCPKFVKDDMLKKGAILIDGGITVKNNKIMGDADRSVAKKVSFLTPVPGGVGPLTVALLLKNVYFAAERTCPVRTGYSVILGRGGVHLGAKKYYG